MTCTTFDWVRDDDDGEAVKFLYTKTVFVCTDRLGFEAKSVRKLMNNIPANSVPAMALSKKCIGVIGPGISRDLCCIGARDSTGDDNGVDVLLD